MLKHIYTSAEVRAMDQHAAEHLSLPTAVLMENAGRAIAQAVLELPARDRVVVVCGKGNNGGDGYVAARHLAIAGRRVATLSQDSIDSLKGDAKRNALAATACGVDSVDDLSGAGVIVDAIFGTGLTRPPEGRARELIERINASGAFVVAVDVPSGVDADRPHPPGVTVRADVTVALHCLKPAHVQHPARALCGAIRVADIGLPIAPDTSGTRPPVRIWADNEWAAGRLARRGTDAHKGTAGHLLVVAGSPGKTGAAFMSCAAALRSGAGLVTLASARSVIESVLPQLPEAMGQVLEKIEPSAIIEALERKNALALGPGIARDDRTGEAIADVLKSVAIPAIIDADGLNALSQSPVALKELRLAKVAPVLTPHPAELARLLGCTTDDVQRDRLASATEAARRFNAHVVLKGACSVVAHPGGALAVNSTGNAAMATAGMGDVLSGVVGALLGQRIDAADAAEIATYVHGRAGDLAAVGDRGLIAADVITKLPAALAEVTAQ